MSYGIINISSVIALSILFGSFLAGVLFIWDDYLQTKKLLLKKILKALIVIALIYSVTILYCLIVNAHDLIKGLAPIGIIIASFLASTFCSLRSSSFDNALLELATSINYKPPICIPKQELGNKWKVFIP